MLLSLLRRTGVFLASVAAASVLVFLFMAVLPGDAAEVSLGTNATPEAVRAVRAEFGTDRPLPTQYLDWVGGLLQGDFGRSYISREAVAPQIGDRVQVTLILVGAATLVALLIAVPLGTLAAARHRRASGLALSGASQVGAAVPAFIAGILLVALFSVTLGWFPSSGWTAPSDDVGGFLRQLALPAISLGLVEGAILTRYVRSAVLEVLREDFLRTARAKGLTRGRALVRHGLRNAAIPVVTVLGLQLSGMLIGAVVIERVYVLPGLGTLLLDGVSNRDLLLVQGVVMVLVVLVLLINYVVDVLYTVIDPRLRGA
ncbi:ABC transporter permease [Patulibacter sp. SYSU D01012]|uniref:ABC transporter permease n=1 Tax=Patulibacter sp. SYSU D01012 TaxID=2817381 RepID=UPI001B31718F|nr:ABC transporter permease [Patulibacter sp. SYSU D01012]